MQPDIKAFFDEATFTVSYLVSDPETSSAAIIDSVLDFDPASGRIARHSADRIAAAVEEQGLEVEWILETHVHADHLTAAPYLKERLGGLIGIGENITLVQETFGDLYNAGPDFRRDGSQFDHLFPDNAAFCVGVIQAKALHVPGHTPVCTAFLIGDAVFVGDTLFMPDYGTARCDFPGGDARRLYRSIRRLLELPPETRLLVGHDYKAPGRDAFAWETTVAEQRAKNIHIRDGVSEDDFVAMREDRDKTLPMPRLMLPAVQVNMRAGGFPEPEENGVTYLKLPLDRF